MKALRRHRHWSLVPAMLWIAAQLIMTGGVISAPAGAAAAGLVSPDATIVICTPYGLRTVPASAMPDSGSPDAPAAAGKGAPAGKIVSYQCPWCQVLGSAVVPPQVDGKAACGASHARIAYRLSDQVDGGFPSAAEGIDGRAPPRSEAVI